MTASPGPSTASPAAFTANPPTALVTGASRGIGHATALALADEGFNIAAVAWRDDERLGALEAEVAERGRCCVGFDQDISELAGHARLLDAVQARFGDLHCLVNNAGVSVLHRGDLLDVGLESYERCFAVNTRGTFFLAQAVARRMVAATEQTPQSAQPYLHDQTQRHDQTQSHDQTQPHDQTRPHAYAHPQVHRSMVFVTSSNAVAATVERGEYCMSKTATSMAARLFAIRLAQAGIGVYEVQPGLILTEMTAPSKAKYDDLIARGMTVERRWGQPEDVARVIRTMAAGLLPYTVAQDVRVDGGLLLTRF